MHHEYSSSVSPFHAKTGTPVAAILFQINEDETTLLRIIYIRGSCMVLSRENVLNKFK